MPRSLTGIMLQALLWRWLVTIELRWAGWRPKITRLRWARWYGVEWLLLDASIIVMAKKKRGLRAGIQVQHRTRALCVYLGTALKDFAA